MAEALNVIIVESTKSSIRSLAEVKAHTHGLNAKRSSILNKIPNIGDYVEFEKDYIEESDLAYLTAWTDNEFAWLTGKNHDLLYHGEKYHCCFDENLTEALLSKKYSIYMHSHPDEDNPVPSKADRNVLIQIGQKTSKIISATTKRVIEYSSNSFLDYLL